ncbi:DNA topoisomerase IB [Nesterenkonia flava]|uniref:DNA topoisomerase n=1 Tax=Nesterenkonia flava TaxID=469799 RepID=A0ABU1FTS5_9MICC|nr:DNA topoisomerase IB [Nesterenkonia flava]MDR5711551.1 DNA topoisomerase IB [Nesterenkonia flava]
MPRLKRVRPVEDSGFQRREAREGFTYVDAAGKPAAESDCARIERLAIPPAWTDVWICADEHGHVQAVGTDDAGRRQYIYHDDWSARRDRGKFSRALDLAARLPAARARVTAALHAEGMTEQKVLAAAFRLLDRGALRAGSTTYLRRSGNRGLTTLQCRHVTVADTTITLCFPGKGGQQQEISVTDSDLAPLLQQLTEGRTRATLLSWREGRRRRSVRPSQLNAYVREVTGGRFTAKDFRTLRGTILAVESLARTGPATTKRERAKAERRAVQACADGLGNTPAVAKSSYIDPRVFKKYRRGQLLDTSRTPESALRSLLLG